MSNNKQNISKMLIITLSCIYAVSPFAIDSYLPALPIIANEMQVDISMLSMTVSLYILGLAVGQLIGGPLSDKHGRLPIMVLGLGLFALASLLLTTSTQISELWLWRILQAIGGGIAIVGVPATIRDNADGKEAAKLFALVSLIMMVAPSIAPSVGNFILSHHHWHWIFYFVTGVSILAIIMAIKFIPHQPSKTKQAATKRTKGIKFIDVFKHKQALGYMIAQSFAFAVMITFVTNSAMIYMGAFKVSADTFSILFALNIFGLIIINRINTFLLNRFESAILLRFWLSMQVCGAFLLVLSTIFLPHYLALSVAAFVMTVSANGGIVSNSNACFLKFFGKDAGTASAVLGALQCATAATISAIAALISMGQVLPVVILMFASTSIALLAVIYSNKQSSIALQIEEIGAENNAVLLMD
ncbi:multidrug effflux MFS transporter [Psychromonas sp. Urea-02u-13]|uniref:multidrug effflux MFS transporter n=1 Tax=Psychromonas sp. Urea-02u-13 TaxID=2058326 RepID=UPI000C348894|nr:multidrug effflux MFS transporter [Psychromonas sp. Urea-02u-13]PKG37292.1 Bcr/CflA family drug resistance efflux transporter [Psychromonas sp. Urea-02u-13]